MCGGGKRSSCTCRGGEGEEILAPRSGVLVSACCPGNHWCSGSGLHALFDGAWRLNQKGNRRGMLPSVFNAEDFCGSPNRECHSISSRYTGIFGLKRQTLGVIFFRSFFVLFLAVCFAYCFIYACLFCCCFSFMNNNNNNNNVLSCFCLPCIFSLVLCHFFLVLLFYCSCPS